MAIFSEKKVLAFSGGVGGAKLALGLAKILPPEQLTIVANTADDFEHLGLHVSPDLDTVMYTLAGLSNSEQGWGLAGESWQCMSALQTLGGQTWFRLGDKDLATHFQRTQLLKSGHTLTEVTQMLCRQLGVAHPVIPMSDDPVRTVLDTDLGALAFQHYFVREQCRPRVSGFRFDGIDRAQPAAALMQSLNDDKLAAIVICPSNPFVSVEPILSLPGLKAAIKKRGVPIVAVSPIIKGAAVKGPAAKMMQELSMLVSADAVARYYRDTIDGFVLDRQDAELADTISACGLQVEVVNTLMKTLDDRMSLASDVLRFVSRLTEHKSAKATCESGDSL